MDYGCILDQHAYDNWCVYPLLHLCPMRRHFHQYLFLLSPIIFLPLLDHLFFVTLSVSFIFIIKVLPQWVECVWSQYKIKMLHRAATNAYSWWWASHIRTKQSKWLEQSLQGNNSQTILEWPTFSFSLDFTNTPLFGKSWRSLYSSQDALLKHDAFFLPCV